jgi:hypothetical protein
MTTALPEVVVFGSATDFRAWLEENHEAAPELHAATQNEQLDRRLCGRSADHAAPSEQNLTR